MDVTSADAEPRIGFQCARLMQVEGLTKVTEGIVVNDEIFLL